jgi:hypothetical protein
MSSDTDIDNEESIYIPPSSKAGVHKRLRELNTELENIVDEESANIIIREIDVLHDQLIWYRGYSDLTEVTEDGHEYDNYFKMIVPGAEFDSLDNTGMNRRQYVRLRKEAIKNDLIRYYRYSNRMLRQKAAIMKTLVETLNQLQAGYGKYSENAGFAVNLADNKRIISRYDDVIYIRTILQTLTKEYTYIYKAKGIQSPYGASIPLNFMGQFKRIVLTKAAQKWLQNELALRDLRVILTGADSNAPIWQMANGEAISKPYQSHLDADQIIEEYWPQTYAGRGMLMINDLQTLIRLALLGRQSYYYNNDRKIVRYKYTDDMKRYLNVEGYVDNMKVRSFARTLVETKIPPIHAWFFRNYTPDNELFIEFIDEMGEIQEYADVVYQEKYVIDKEIAKMKAAEKRKAKRAPTKARQKKRRAK